MSIFTRLSAAAVAFKAPINDKVVRVTRTTSTVEVPPNITVERAVEESTLLHSDYKEQAHYKIKSPNGFEKFVGLDYVCQPGEELVIIVNVDSKG